MTGGPLGVDGAHEHGVVRMGLVVEDGRVAMDLQIPGYALFGFEHTPASDAEWSAVESALSRLNDGVGRVVAFPAEASCRLESFEQSGAPSRHGSGETVRDGVEDHDTGDTSHDREASHGQEGQHSHDHGEDEDHAHDEETGPGSDHDHSEVEVSAVFTCAQTLSGRTGSLRLTEIVDDVPQVDLTVLTAHGQAAARVGSTAEFRF